MADLFIVKERLKLSLKLAATGVALGALATWHFWTRIEFESDRANFLLSATVTGALALAWLGLLVSYLAARRVMDPGHHNPGARGHFPWWAVKLLLFAGVLVAGGIALNKYAKAVEGEFALLRGNDLPMLEARILADPALLEKPEGKNGGTLLQVAFRENHPEAVALLLANGASREGLEQDGMNIVVASLENLPMLNALLNAGFDPDKPDAKGVPPIHHAVAKRLVDAVKVLLEAGAQVDARDQTFRTPLMRVVEADDLEMAALLLDHRADVNAFDRRGESPLHRSVRKRSAEGSRLLLERGGDPRQFNFFHMTPLHIAVNGGHTNLVSILLERPNMAGLYDEGGRVPLDHALKGHSFETADLLIGAGADVDFILANGETLMHETILSRDYQTARYLIRAGASVHIPNAKGETAHAIMRRKQLHGLLELVEMRDNPEAFTNAVDSAELSVE